MPRTVATLADTRQGAPPILRVWPACASSAAGAFARGSTASHGHAGTRRACPCTAARRTGIDRQMTGTMSTSTLVTGGALRSAFVLASLVRGVSSKHGGVHAARVFAGLGALATLVAAIRLARDFGPDRATIHIVAWGAYGVTWMGAVPAGLALAQRGKAASAQAGFDALARVRGMSARAIEGAEIGACVAGIAEVVFLPLLVLAVAVGALAMRAPVEGGVRALGGLALFGLAAALVLGVLTGCCRCWGGRHGRLWLIGAVVGPWLLSSLVPGGSPSASWSIPGLLDHLWRMLTAV